VLNMSTMLLLLAPQCFTKQRSLWVNKMTIFHFSYKNSTCLHRKKKYVIMTSFSENAKHVNKNGKYDPSNDLGNSHMKGCHFLWTTRYITRDTRPTTCTAAQHETLKSTSKTLQYVLHLVRRRLLNTTKPTWPVSWSNMCTASIF